MTFIHWFTQCHIPLADVLIKNEENQHNTWHLMNCIKIYVWAYLVKWNRNSLFYSVFTFLCKQLKWEGFFKHLTRFFFLKLKEKCQATYINMKSLFITNRNKSTQTQGQLWCMCNQTQLTIFFRFKAINQNWAFHIFKSKQRNDFSSVAPLNILLGNELVLYLSNIYNLKNLLF